MRKLRVDVHVEARVHHDRLAGAPSGPRTSDAACVNQVLKLASWPFSVPLALVAEILKW
jgi:hypothetical protein